MSHSPRKAWKDAIMEYSKELRLPMIRKHLDEHVQEANQRDVCYEEFLAEILEKECDARREASRYNRIRMAEFTHKKYLEDLSIQDLPEDAQKKLKMLKTLEFIPEGRNVILAGNSGTGKTHIATGLGLKACLEGYKVWFTTVPLLINRIKECRAQQTLRVFQNRFEKYDLVIAEGSELLFTHLSLRAGRKSTIITTNLSFERWGEIFQDPVMTAAMIDRLTHQSYLVNMNGNSYRMKETMAKGLHVIGMIRDMKQRYDVGGKRMNLQELYRTIPGSKSAEILGSVIVKTGCGLPVKLVFVQNRNKRRDWLVVLSTDVTLDAAEIVRIYGMRWSIETFFKFTKSYLKLGTEFQGRSFDMLVSHTTIVFSRYLVMEWERRQENDARSLGGLFYLFSDEVRDLDLKTALQQLMAFFLDVVEAKTKRDKTSIFRQLYDWISGLPNYIKGLLPKFSCES